MKPLLICNTVEYRGSEVPTSGLEGMVIVEGMSEGDALLIHNGGDPLSVVANGMYGPFHSATLRAERAVSTGSEVSAWVV